MKQLAVSFQLLAMGLWRERWNVLMGGGLFGLGVLIVKWIGG